MKLWQRIWVFLAVVWGLVSLMFVLLLGEPIFNNLTALVFLFGVPAAVAYVLLGLLAWVIKPRR